MAIRAQAFHWVSAGRTDVGKVRKLNEDALLQRPDRGIWAVADGMGGHAAGDLASASVVAALGDIREERGLDALVTQARRQLARFNAARLNDGRLGRARIVGSTVVVLLAAGRDGAVLWAGDSRLYRFRRRRLERLTDDHSRIQELIASGQLDPGQAEQHPEANVITRAVGVAETLELSSRRFRIQDGDGFLLCSDGLTRYVDAPRVAIALREPTCQAACDRLVAAALESPARDNVTVVVARAVSEDSGTRTVLNPALVNPDDDPTEPHG